MPWILFWTVCAQALIFLGGVMLFCVGLSFVVDWLDS